MKPITELTREDIKDLKLICFDVDGVTIKKGTDIEEVKTPENTTLTVKTSNLLPEVLDGLIKLKKHYFVAISSGRSSLYLTKIFTNILWGNTALLSEIGIFTLIEGELIQHEKFDKRTLKKMRDIRVALQNLEGKVKDFRAFEPKQFLITLHAFSEISEVYDIMKKLDPEEEFYAIWNGEAFDIAPKRLNKGTGLKNLTKHLGIDIKQTMAVGNGPNDKDMTDTAGIGVTTEPKWLKSDFYTTGDQYLGGMELINKLLELNKISPSVYK
jgi:HAD superfamily hydrolase (TIGR01484 family)